MHHKTAGHTEVVVRADDVAASVDAEGAVAAAGWAVGASNDS
jgi:hypothetical protein